MILMMTMSLIMMFMSMMFLTAGIILNNMNKIIIIEWLIIEMNSMKMNMFILLDNKTMFFVMMILIISSSVIFYSIEYMNMNIYSMNKYTYLIMMFLMSMIIMIMSPNMLTILLGWDGLGLISYCLIIFYNNMKSYSAGMLTVILNRIGDASLIILICMMIKFGSWNLMLYKMNKIMMIMLVIMAFTKSAQLPFSSWLPAAMMAPTPVSSLVHSSTLVTAGVYLLIRYKPIMLDSFNETLLLISSLTMLISGIMANFECDLKKIIALSTLSQLGFMMSILFMNMEKLAFMHLMIHAMFKSMMFLCSGSFIHYMNSSQDIRDYSGMMKIYPYKSMIMMISMMSLCGFPFLCGFYSKDLIMEYFFCSKMNMTSLINLMIGTMFTVSYSTKVLLILYSNKSPTYNNMNYMNSKLMNTSMMIMMTMSLFFSKYYMNMMYMDYNFNLPKMYKFMVLKLCIVGMIMGMQMNKYMNNKYMNNLSLMTSNMMMMNNLYKHVYIKPFSKIMKYDDMVEKKMFEEMMNKLYSTISLYMKIMKFKMFNMKTILLMYLIYMTVMSIII
uniref:NADH-ubiquinone oxidoreductase chain 5 n=1 Tax=Habropoda radoszkowskii TaxID=597470 RepID=A0A7L8EYU5_9HYME|nr:NADH dehydrogenase subunit 5 [Habropoda radoszkowskii]QOE17512.1 NADH dehydrogenase subunit 5 [Habropoda radoszkowskii]